MNALTVSTLRPGILVSLSATITGNVKHYRREIEPETVLENGMSTRAVNETTTTIADKDEHERAVKARGKCRSVITGICAKSDFGLLCPADRRDQLEKAIAEARQIAREFNAGSSYSTISVYVVCGMIAQDDAEAVRAINFELRGLISDMKTGLESLDVEKIRAAANKARDVGQMLSPQAQSRIQEAIDAARKAARVLVKAGETGEQEIDRLTIFKLESARNSFLDLDDQQPIGEVEHTGRAVDFELADTFDAPSSGSVASAVTVNPFEIN